MRLSEFLCLGGTEIANSARVTAYARNLGYTGGTLSATCPCFLIDEDFVSPDVDPAPWYDITRAESEEFYGFYAWEMRLQPVLSRSARPTGRQGSVISPATMRGRQLQVQGALVASTMRGMAYGERWLAEVLRGSPCNQDDCPTDDMLILPACPPEDDYDDADIWFRTLVDAGCVDGPVFSQIETLPECFVQGVSFNVVSSQPWLYHPTERCLDGDAIFPDYYDGYYGNPLSCSLTTPEWMGEGTFIIDVTAQSDLTDLVITGRISLEDDCPVEDPATSVMPTFVYTVPEMKMDDRIVIDGMRKHAYYYDASEKFPRAALSRMSFDGPFIWPDVGTCTTMCVTLEVGSGEATATVDTVLREI